MEKRNLIKQLKSENKLAINELYESYSSRLYRFAFGYLKSEADTLDIIQEVFIRLWNSRHQLKEDTNLESFLFTITRNTIISKEKGYTNQAIANELHISIKTVEDHMTKARKFLKENLREYGLLAILFFELFIS